MQEKYSVLLSYLRNVLLENVTTEKMRSENSMFSNPTLKKG